MSDSSRPPEQAPALPLGPVDERTGLRAEELALLQGLTSEQKAAVVVELGGTWPEQVGIETSSVMEATAHESDGVGDVALSGSGMDKVETEALPTQKDASIEEAESQERKEAVQAISENPDVSVAVDYWDGGSAWGVLRDYRYLKFSDKFKDPTPGSEGEGLRADFDVLRFLHRQYIHEDMNIEFPWAKGRAGVVKFEREEGVTYKILMVSPKAVDRRPDVEMLISIPASSGLIEASAKLDPDPAMFLELFAALTADQTASHRENRSFRMSDLIKKVRTPIFIGPEYTESIRKNINSKPGVINLRQSSPLPGSKPAPQPPSRPVVPPPTRRRFGKHR